MSGTTSRARQIAEMAFDKTQPQFRDRTHGLQEWDAQTSERAEKTGRLRTAGLEREQAGKSVAALPPKEHHTNPT